MIMQRVYLPKKKWTEEPSFWIRWKKFIFKRDAVSQNWNVLIAHLDKNLVKYKMQRTPDRNVSAFELTFELWVTDVNLRCGH